MMKRSDPTDIWAWTQEDEERLTKQGAQHTAIIENYHEFWHNYDSDYVAAELAINQALEAARAVDEIKWQLHLRHWRLQLWLNQRQTKRALPEAVDLLSLATDPRVRDVPQRICAVHDIVECYVHMDSAGYYEDIVATAQDVLAQLPKRHPCATCARSNLAHSSAAVGKKKDAARWLSQTRALHPMKIHNGLVLGFGRTSILMDEWDDAERYYLEARKTAQEEKDRPDFIEATLSLVRVYLEQQKIQPALDMLQNGRQNMKFHGGPNNFAQLAEMEGYVAAAIQQPLSAITHLQRATRLYLDLGSYRNAAQDALYAAEIAQNPEIEASPSLSETLNAVLDLAATAVGQLPPSSQDLYQKLASFGRTPTAPTPSAYNSTTTTAEELTRQELQALQDLLQEQIAQRHIANISMALFRLAVWHADHEQGRAAIDYLIAEAALERLVKLSLDDREDALSALKRLATDLPDGTISSTLLAAQSGPPAWLQPLFPALPLSQWRWVMRGIEAELADEPFVEPEPTAEDADTSFNDWLNHTGSMTALILRFKDRLDPQEFIPWAEAMDDTAEKMLQQEAEHAIEMQPIISLVRGFAALAHGTSVAEVASTVQPPFTEIITQTAEIAETPVWFHPDASPIDFLVEQAAQKAVQALRRYDEERPRRLKNLVLRYTLMNMDLNTHEQLAPIARFIEALSALVLLDGKQLPVLPQPLEPPFASVLTATFSAGQLNPTGAEDSDQAPEQDQDTNPQNL